MIRTLKALFGLVQREDATTGELAPSLPAAEAELASAREALAAVEASYRRALLSSDEAEHRELDAARDEAARRIERAEALCEALRERLADAREREAEADRVAVYEAARAQADDARRALVEMYPQIAGELVRLLEVVAQAEVEVEAANANLPRGAVRLASVERAARDVPAEPDEVLSEVEVERWVQVGGLKPGNFDQSNVYETAPGRGVIKAAGQPLNTCTQVELRTFTERRVRRGAGGKIAYRLAERLVLPGFRPSDLDHWRPLSSGAKASEIVRQVEALRYAKPAPASSGSGTIVTELVPAPGAERVRELEPSPPTRPYRGAYADVPDTAERV